jgi:nitrogen PTS system EIIA component
VKLDTLVTVDRVGLVVAEERLEKGESLRRLAALLAKGGVGDDAAIYAVLREREELQSTGIGDGVAVPHGTIEGAPGQIGAVLLCPGGVAFDAIDDKPARILFGVIGPRQAVEHLKVLARVSRLLRRPDFRERLLAERDPQHAYELLRDEDDALG